MSDWRKRFALRTIRDRINGATYKPQSLVMAWHFVGATLRDGRSVPADGDWLIHDGPLVLCAMGLHASLDPLDALSYAPGPVLCRVELAGTMLYGNDKVVARRRRIVARRDMTDALKLFARECASDALHLWDAPRVVRDYLATGDETIRAAAYAAACDAARAAASDAARAAAWDAARAAARAAAWDAAYAGALSRQRARWQALVTAQFGDGAMTAPARAKRAEGYLHE